MAKSIIFGRNVNGPGYKQINMPDISSQHAKITFLGNDQFEVEDLNSSNGTYVNGYRIRKMTVSINDQVRLSAGVVIDLVKEFGLNPTYVPNGEIKKSNAKDFTVEFERLKDVQIEYRNARKTLKSKHNKSTALMRGGISFTPMIAMIVAQIYQSAISHYLTGITILGSTAASYFTSNKDIQDEMDDLYSGYSSRYVCPQCKRQLGLQNSWVSIHDTGACFSCGAIYNKSKL